MDAPIYIMPDSKVKEEASWYSGQLVPTKDNLIPRGPSFDCLIRPWNQQSVSVDYKMNGFSASNLNLEPLEYLNGDEDVFKTMSTESNLEYVLKCTNRIIISATKEGGTIIRRSGTGVFVTKRHLLTAEHLFDGLLEHEIDQINILLGESDGGGSPRYVRAARIDVRTTMEDVINSNLACSSESSPLWRPQEGDLDIAVLEVERPVASIEPMLLAHASPIKAHQVLCAIGFPILDNNFDYSECVTDRFLTIACRKLGKEDRHQIVRKFVASTLFNWSCPVVSFGLRLKTHQNISMASVLVRIQAECLAVH